MQLAIQEESPDEVETTREHLEAAIFCEHPKVFVDVVEHPQQIGAIAAFALYWIDFPTWQGKHGIYIEDICVTNDLRGKGIGRALMSHLAKICVERGYVRLAWWVKNNNAPAVRFYKDMGADIKDDFIVRHLTGANLAELARRF